MRQQKIKVGSINSGTLFSGRLWVCICIQPCLILIFILFFCTSAVVELILSRFTHPFSPSLPLLVFIRESAILLVFVLLLHMIRAIVIDCSLLRLAL